MWCRTVTLLLLVYLYKTCLSHRSEMCTVLRRSQMTYVLTESQKQELVNRGYNFSQNPHNGIFTFTSNPKNGELFLTAQNFFSYSGVVPYALGVQKTYEYDAPVYPFPSFEENNNPPYGLYSAAFTALDKCGNLWILDQGSRSWSYLKPVFSPGLFRYNLAQKRMTLRYRFPSEFFLSEKGTAPTTLIVDNSFSCDKLKLIVADPITQSLLIFDLESESSWQIQHPSMSHDPEHSTFTSDNYTLSIPSGVYSTAITPPLGKSKTKFLIYSSYAGITTYAVPLSIVYNKNLWTQGYSIWRENKVKNKSQKVKQWFHQKGLEDDFSFINVDNYFQKIGSDPTHLGQYCDIDWERKAQFCAVPSEGAIDYWKLDEPFKNRRAIVKNKSEFLNGAILHIIKNRYGKNEIVLSTSPITKIFLGVIQPDSRNYAVFTCLVDEILKGDHKNCTSGIFKNCQK